MGKMYTLDKKLLCSSPEIRIGEKVYPVDDRKNTVIKVTKLFNDSKGDVEKVVEALELAFGETFKEIDEMDLSFAAYQKLFELVIAAMTGEEPKDEDSFPEQ